MASFNSRGQMFHHPSKKKSKKDKKKEKIVPDVIKSYASKRHGSVESRTNSKQSERPPSVYDLSDEEWDEYLRWESGALKSKCTPADVHEIATKIFGKTGYISFESLIQ